MKRLKTLKGAVIGAAALVVALAALGGAWATVGLPVPATKGDVSGLRVEVGENSQIIWTRARRADQRDLWDLEQRCKQNGGCTVDQADQKRRLMDDIKEAEGQLRRVKKGQ